MFDAVIVELLDVIVKALATLLSAGLVYGIKQGLGFLKLKTSESQYSFLQSAAKTVVRFLEQTGVIDELLKEGARKKEAALVLLENFAKEHGIPVSYELLDTLIEEAVQIMNEAIRAAAEESAEDTAVDPA
jgi:hypothetical protein